MARPVAGRRRYAVGILAVVAAVLAVAAGARGDRGGIDGEGTERAPTTAAVGRAAGAEPEEPGWRLGVFRGSKRPDLVAAHERWLGRSVEVALEMIPFDSWARVDDPTPVIRAWAGTPYDVVFTTPMLPEGGATLAEGAAGAYDEHWRRFGEAFVGEGRPDAMIRLGHELNHDHYPWTATGGREADYAAYYRRIVDVLRSVPGADLRFIWNVLSGVDTADAEAAYPGDGHVDIVSVDLYDGAQDLPDPEARWQQYRTQPYGLDWLVRFAAAHGKPMAFDEWGLIASTDHDRRDPSGDSGDNVLFVDRMLDFFETHDVAHASYFDWQTDHGRTDSRISSDTYPSASARYRERVGRGASPATSTSTTTGGGDRPLAFVVGNAARLPAKDGPTRDRLEQLGFDVRLVDDDAVAGAPLAPGTPVVVASSVVPEKVPPALARHDGPVVSLETYAHPTLGMATTADEHDGRTALEIVAEDHPVAAGLRGSVIVQRAGELGAGEPVPGSEVVASTVDGTPAIWVIDAGTAPARRVALFFSYDSPPVLTDDGWALFDAAVGWATAGP